MTSLLARWEKTKKDKHSKHCNAQQNILHLCSFSVLNTREGIPSYALQIELSHGIEKGRTPFASTGVGKRTHLNHCCKVLLTDYVRVVNRSRDTEGICFAHKSFLQCGIGFNYNGLWEGDQLKPQLKDIIKKYPLHFTGKATVGDET